MTSTKLGQELDVFVATLVETGRYRSADDVVRAGVRLLQEREARMADLHAKIDEGRADVRAGRVRDADEVFDELEDRYTRMIPDAA